MLNFSCSCGYEKAFNLGEGLFAIDKDRIREMFTPQELMGFESAVAKGSCSYGYGDRSAFCKSCDDLVAATVLRYSNVLEDGTFTQESLVIKGCSVCGNEITLCNEPYGCPKCKNNLAVSVAGYWD
jgi:hypothetical protein